MHYALTLILVAQLAGEVAVRGLGIAVPGPVLGMALLLGIMVLSGPARRIVQPVGEGILRHLSLLFVPAGVGVVGHLDQLGAQGLAVLLALVVSTVLAIAVGALTFVAVARFTADSAGGEDA